MDRTERLAQFGYIVITVGNRGGNPSRSKWYHTYGYGNLRDYGLADKKTAMYYMTCRGGMLWKSKDLKFWDGPFQVVKTDPASWMGPHPMIWAAELHEYRNRYTRRIPHLFEVDDSGDKLIVREPYIP